MLVNIHCKTVAESAWHLSLAFMIWWPLNTLTLHLCHIFHTSHQSSTEYDESSHGVSFLQNKKKNRVRPNQVECVYIHIGRSSNWEDPSTWDEEKDISILFGYSINLTICYLSRQKQPLFCLTCGFCFFNGFTSFINENFFDGVRDRSSCSLFKIFLFRHFISSIYNILI
jgi:hypothetical protein